MEKKLTCGAAACKEGCALRSYLEEPSVDKPEEAAETYDRFPNCPYRTELGQTYEALLEQSRKAREDQTKR